MLAVRLHDDGLRVEEIETPSPGPGEVLVRVRAAALNPIDIAIGTGRFYGGSPEPPYVIGSEAVGTAPDGRRVWFRGNGAGAEQAAASQQNPSRVHGTMMPRP